MARTFSLGQSSGKRGNRAKRDIKSLSKTTNWKEVPFDAAIKVFRAISKFLGREKGTLGTEFAQAGNPAVRPGGRPSDTWMGELLPLSSRCICIRGEQRRKRVLQEKLNGPENNQQNPYSLGTETVMSRGEGNGEVSEKRGIALITRRGAFRGGLPQYFFIFRYGVAAREDREGQTGGKSRPIFFRKARKENGTAHGGLLFCKTPTQEEKVEGARNIGETLKGVSRDTNPISA